LDHPPTEKKDLCHSGTRSGMAACLLLLALGILVYANSLQGPFIYDDHIAIVNNEHIRSLWPPLGILSAPLDSAFQARPVASLTAALNYAFGGLEVRGYHAFNVALHLMAALVLFGIIRQTLLCEKLAPRFEKACTWIALVCAMLWMVHPLQTEVVNYTSQRTQSLMGLFYLLTLYCAIRARGSKRGRFWCAAAVIFCALGMASKESMVTAPLMVLIYDLTFGSGSWRRRLGSRIGLYAGLASTWGILVALMMAYPLTNVGFYVDATPFNYALNQCQIITRYLSLAFWPNGLALDYGFVQTVTITDVAPYGALVLTLLAAAIVLLILRPRLGFTCVWFFIILAPTSSFVPMPTEVGAERRMYLPLAGLIVLIVIWGYLWIAPRIKSIVRRNEVYGDIVSLWRSAVEARPQNARATFGLGDVLMTDNKPDEAILHFRRAIEINPNYTQAHNNLGNALLMQGKPEEAARHFRKASRSEGKGAMAHFNLARLMQSEGKTEEAISQYRLAIAADPGLAPAHNNLGNLLTEQGKLKEAIQSFRRAVEAQSDYALALYNLGKLLKIQGKVKEAQTQLFKAVEIDPGYAKAFYELGRTCTQLGKIKDAMTHYQKAIEADSEYAEAHLDLGMALAMRNRQEEALDHFRKADSLKPDWPAALNGMARILSHQKDPSQGKAEEAIRHAERAVSLTQRGNALYLDTLAASYAAAGRFDRAEKTAQEALELATSAKNKKLIGKITKQLIRYRKEKSAR